MDAELKQEIQEIIEVAKGCPENLQTTVAEILLSDLLRNRRTAEAATGGRDATEKDRAKPGLDDSSASNGAEQTGTKQGGSEFRLPLRLKAFLKKYGIGQEKLDVFFHMEEGQVVPIWSLTATKIAEGQIQIALLTALESAIKTGEFAFAKCDIHAACKEHKVEETNWSNNFKNNSRLFGSLDKDGPISLSERCVSIALRHSQMEFTEFCSLRVC
jgi:hypothetical protein